MLGVNTIQFCSRTIYIKMEFSFQRREMLLFLTTNMAAVMSGANHQKNFLRLGAKSRLETKRKRIFRPNRSNILRDVTCHNRKVSPGGNG